MVIRSEKLPEGVLAIHVANELQGEPITLTKWFAQEGDEVYSGEVIAEIETDKATMEIEAEQAGILSRIFIDEGDAIEEPSIILGAITINTNDAEQISPSPLTALEITTAAEIISEQNKKIAERLQAADKKLSLIEAI